MKNRFMFKNVMLTQLVFEIQKKTDLVGRTIISRNKEKKQIWMTIERKKNINGSPFQKIEVNYTKK